MNDQEYAAIDAINWSKLKALRSSPKHFKHEAAKPWNDGDTPAMRIGRAAHCFLLDPDQFQRQFVYFAGDKRKKTLWTAFQDEHSGKTILNKSEYYRALGIATAVADHPLARSFLATGLKEAALTWTDKETGVLCKGRVDHAGLHLVDVKTCAQIDPRLFANQSARLGYHCQLAFYKDGLAENGVRVAPEPVIIAVESDEPYDVVVYALPEPVVDIGRDEYRRLLNVLKRCREQDSWPGYAPDQIELTLPAWVEDYSDIILTSGGEEMAF